MAPSSPASRLTDIVEAIELIRDEMAGVTLAAFEHDRRKRWLVERGIEIISEASRRLSAGTKNRHREIRGRRWRVSATCSATNMRMWRMTCCGTWCRTIYPPAKKSAATNWPRR
jgi:hypothetical protein